MQQIVFNPEIRSLDDIRNIENQLTNFRSLTGYAGWVLFRGQADFSWSITPSITRFGHTAQELRDLEQTMIEEFAQLLVQKGLSMHWQDAYTQASYQKEWLHLQQAQHYRLPTRLLDWTLKPAIALAFAVLQPEFDNQPGALFMYLAEPGEPWEAEEPRNYLNRYPYDMVVSGEYAIISPGVHYDQNTNQKFGEKRLAKQGGKFILRDYAEVGFDLADHTVFQQRLYKFTIPQDAKPALRDELKNKMKEPVTALSIYYQENDQIDEIVNHLRKKYGLTQN